MMRSLLYRLYVRLMLLRVHAGQWLYQLYLSRRKSDLAEADLSYLNLSGTNLSGADLRNANLRRCDLTDVNFTGADLSGADLTAALVTEKQLAKAASLSGTTLPDGTVHI